TVESPPIVRLPVMSRSPEQSRLQIWTSPAVKSSFTKAGAPITTSLYALGTKPVSQFRGSDHATPSPLPTHVTVRTTLRYTVAMLLSPAPLLTEYVKKSPPMKS